MTDTVAEKKVTRHNATVDEAIDSFIRYAGMDGSKVIEHRGGNLPVARSDFKLDYNDTLYSYGSHFPLAQLMPDERGPRGWWLLNGDRWGGGARNYTGTTDYHQRTVRAAVEASGMQFLIVSFSALREAGIRRGTIRRVAVDADRWEYEPRVWEGTNGDGTGEHDPARGALQGHYAYSAVTGEAYETGSRAWQQRLSDHRFIYEEAVHHLGESLFTAHYETWMVRTPSHFDFQLHRHVGAVREHVSETAYFLSAFDQNEGFGLYFLCQLPAGAYPETVAEAREALKPIEVVHYETVGESRRGEVLRQGDVFAVPYPNLATRDLPGPSKRSAYVLNTNHVATEARIDGMGNTYARGILRHRPAGRLPDHRNVPLGDGKTWYLLVRNTVPEGRAWSAGQGSSGSHVD